jgi:hypothetical protein
MGGVQFLTSAPRPGRFTSKETALVGSRADQDVVEEGSFLVRAANRTLIPQLSSH